MQLFYMNSALRYTRLPLHHTLLSLHCILLPLQADINQDIATQLEVYVERVCGCEGHCIMGCPQTTMAHGCGMTAV